MGRHKPSHGVSDAGKENFRKPVNRTYNSRGSQNLLKDPEIPVESLKGIRDTGGDPQRDGAGRGEVEEGDNREERR